MPVDSKSVRGRRELSFVTLDDAVADARNLVESPRVRVLGNWQLANLLTHLAFTINHAIDGFPMKAPLWVRVIAPWFKKSAMKKMTPGIKLPQEREAEVFPAAASAREALDLLVSAVARTKNERMTSPHPAFGKMTHEEWVVLNLRHCELHLSFAVPD